MHLCAKLAQSGGAPAWHSLTDCTSGKTKGMKAQRGGVPLPVNCDGDMGKRFPVIVSPGRVAWRMGTLAIHLPVCAVSLCNG